MRPRAVLSAVLTTMLVGTAACRESSVAAPEVALTPDVLSQHCREAIGPSRVEQLSERVWLAIGFDLGNTIVIRTAHGRIVVDTMMSPERAAEAKAAIDAEVPGPTHAVILTHSHIDHVGGTSVWLDAETQIWATDAFPEHFVKQYGVFQEAERARGARQFGAHVPSSALPCSALGRRPDFASSVGAGFRMPTHTFSGERALEIDGVRLMLVEAHGETDDQLFVWLPDERALLPGDNYYQAFPNLYTIRGTRPRSTSGWIASLDAMRRLAPVLLVPSHTVAVRGEAAVQARLTDYRDAIAYLRAMVVDAASRGTSIARLADEARLPAHLANKPYLLPLYGEPSWSVRAMYDNELGWFDGHTEHLYPLALEETARRELALMGGADAVRNAAEHALSEGEARWALHLAAKLEVASGASDAITALRARAERALGEATANTNGRGYLLESALERSQKLEAFKPKIDDAMLDQIPVRVFLDAMPARLVSQDALDEHRSIRLVLDDVGATYTITLRRGVCEVVEGEPLPGRPKPFATLVTDSRTYKELALGRTSALAASTSGRLALDAEDTSALLALPGFFGKFRRGI